MNNQDIQVKKRNKKAVKSGGAADGGAADVSYNW